MHRVILGNDYSRRRAIEAIVEAPDGSVASVTDPKRTLDQNDKMHAMLTDIALSKPLGRTHTPDDWKAIAMNACNWECAFCEGLDGRPFPIGFKSSRLSKAQMSALINWLQAFGDENHVRWSDGQEEGL